MGWAGRKEEGEKGTRKGITEGLGMIMTVVTAQGPGWIPEVAVTGTSSSWPERSPWGQLLGGFVEPHTGTRGVRQREV